VLLSVPLRMTASGVVLWGVVLFALSVAPIHFLAPADWPRFWAGGATVGTSALFNEAQHQAFQQGHRLPAGIWTYPPAFAWFFVPAARVPVAFGYWLWFVLTLGAVALAGWMLAGVFGFPRWFGIVAALAWEPAVYSSVVGQAAAIWLLLIAAVMSAAQRRSPVMLGAAVGMLLLKPTFGVPFALVLTVRREWRACAVVLCFGALWYVTSVAATGGEWGWPVHYLTVIQALYKTDLGALYNGTALPAILVRLGVPASIALGLAVLLFLGVLPRLARVDAVEALSLTSLFAVALSAHVWMYDAAIVLPALFYAMSRLREPWRTWLVVIAYLLAAAWMPIVFVLRFNPIAIVTIGSALLAAIALYSPVWRGQRDLIEASAFGSGDKKRG
jgi:hypothetical protein